MFIVGVFEKISGFDHFTSKVRHKFQYGKPYLGVFGHFGTLYIFRSLLVINGLLSSACLCFGG